MKNVGDNVSINNPNALVEKQRFDIQALQNDLASTNETNGSNALINIITKPDNVEEVASLLESYFEGITSQNTTTHTNDLQVSQRSTVVNIPIEKETMEFPLQDLTPNGRNFENELAVGEEPIDSNSVPEWSLNVGEPSELIVVKQFAESFATAFENEISEIKNNPLSSKKLTKTQYREIAEKCRRVQMNKRFCRHIYLTMITNTLLL
jgi:hypothetical protein